MANSDARPLVVWRICDGRAGHDNQSKGLAQALGRLVPVEIHELPVPSLRLSLWTLLFGRASVADRLPAPNLLIGAGHSTHIPLLAARRARGGYIVVLMRPSLPLGLFDLCLMPEHDGNILRENVIVTQGVLNNIEPSSDRRSDEGLILIGGESRHWSWDEAALLDQIRRIVASASINWELADSRRTPVTTSRQLAALIGPKLRFRPHCETPSDWLPGALARAARVWVTADSVSMVYEALSSGAAVGLLRLPRLGRTRVSNGIDTLVARGLVTPFERWAAGLALNPPPLPLAEAARCAQLIVERFGFSPCHST